MTECLTSTECNAVDVPVTKTAYEDPATRRAWRRTATFRLSAFVFSLASFVA
ncbi:hypothetical protein [Streptomyces pseudovenezuelae]|uniref:hypothetical protein n=1 Tax=Streptomyces pseudovenezuelae TaxID=67350 RepID=UPI002E8187B8|nr:hypothetical protein [Streptomyces pseudovenezuelae]WUA88115.1 hypothetical protein OHO81_12780 [Streptomyces pseudovenezuelae]